MPIGGDRYYTHKIERIYEKKCFNQLTGRVLTKQYITSKKEDWFTAMGIISDFVQITNDNWSMLIGRRYYQIILFIYTLIFFIVDQGWIVLHRFRFFLKAFSPPALFTMHSEGKYHCIPRWWYFCWTQLLLSKPLSIFGIWNVLD